MDKIKLLNYLEELKNKNLRPELYERKVHSMEIYIRLLRKKNTISSLHEDEYLRIVNQYKPHSIDSTKNDQGETRNEIQDQQTPDILPHRPFYRSPYLFVVIAVNLIVCIMIYLFIHEEGENNDPLLPIPVQEGKTLAFTGSLNSESMSTKNEQLDMVLRLYENPESQDSLYSGACLGENAVSLDHSGTFSVVIGEDCGMKPIPEEVLNSNSLYVGISIADNPEISPRIELPTSSYAEKSKTVMGLSVGSDSSRIPYINEQGDIVITAESPSISARSGEFSLSGARILLETIPDSSGSIIFHPDIGGNTVVQEGNFGIGKDPKERLHVEGNQYLSGNLILGADQSTISSHNMGSIRLGDATTENIIIKPSTGISLGTTKSVESITLGSSASPSIDSLYNLGSEDYQWKRVVSNTFVGGDNSINITSEDDKASWLDIGNFGIGTQEPAFTLSVLKKADFDTVASLSNLSATDSGDTSVLRLNLGTDSESSSSRFISFYAGSSSDSDGKLVGSVRINNNAVVYETSAADMAEYFPVEEWVQIGQIIGMGGEYNRKALSGDALIGVVSDSAGFVGNASEKDIDDSALVGIKGQIMTLVSNIDGSISRGDPVSSSIIPGLGSLQTQEGQIIGYVIDTPSTKNFTNNNCPRDYRDRKSVEGSMILCGKVLVYVSPQWYNPDTYIKETGDLELNQTKTVLETAQKDSNSVQLLELKEKVDSLLVDSRRVITPIREETTKVYTESLKALDAKIEALQSDKIVSPIIESEIVKTNDLHVSTISPRRKHIVFDLNRPESDSGKLVVEGKNGPVASIDSNGSANFSGSINTQDITLDQAQANSIRSNTASVSGTLYADRIESETITSILKKLDELSAELSEYKKATASLEGYVQTYNSEPNKSYSYMVQQQAELLLEQDFLSQNNTEGALSEDNIFFPSEISSTLVPPAENKTLVGEELYAIQTKGEKVGRGYIPSGEREIIVYSTQVEDRSLIYLTPLGNNSQVSFAVSKHKSCSPKPQNCTSYFRVARSDSVDEEIYFNWLIIN